ncbi:MAG TPA: hypothetical protein VMC84_12295 [Methanocella sp.]|uniref:hypothetical protein n=1 Tax=Methanocella sp. TaxID=2052833 RepID=UPI002C2B5C31|nr:hypothetical protein [Methanocella sp.]HTY91947.1 hypothetical protein [Methanocella sp.]
MDDTLKIIGLTFIGILGIFLVLIILSILCIFVAAFAYVSLPVTPTVTISPIEIPANFSAIGQTTAVLLSKVPVIIQSI